MGRYEDLRALEQFQIDRYGWATTFVLPEDATTGTACAYTVGLTVKAQPEFVVAGLRLPFAYRLINHLAARVHRDRDQFTNHQHLRGLPGVILGVLVDADPETASPLLRHFDDRYPPGAVRLRQIVWPDADDRFPWDPGYDLRPTLQPVLGPTPPMSAEPPKIISR